VGFVARGMVKEPCEALRRNLGALNDHLIDCLIILALGAPQTEAPKPPWKPVRGEVPTSSQMINVGHR